jgi:hypothetical protein
MALNFERITFSKIPRGGDALKRPVVAAARY